MSFTILVLSLSLHFSRIVRLYNPLLGRVGNRGKEGKGNRRGVQILTRFNPTQLQSKKEEVFPSPVPISNPVQMITYNKFY